MITSHYQSTSLIITIFIFKKNKKKTDLPVVEWSECEPQSDKANCNKIKMRS